MRDRIESSIRRTQNLVKTLAGKTAKMDDYSNQCCSHEIGQVIIRKGIPCTGDTTFEQH